MNRNGRINILAVSSSGGHWEQLLLVAQKIPSENLFFVTTKQELLDNAKISQGQVVADCNQNKVLQTLKCTLQCLAIVFLKRPAVVISTGAAPGLICLALGRLLGAHTIWIDSVANVEKLSLSGKFAQYFAKVWLTQWEHLTQASGPQFAGRVL